MVDLIELAAKCRNPVVRNALMAAASGRERDVAAARRLAFVAARDAGRDANATRAEHERFVRAALAAGLRGDPDAIDASLDMMEGIMDADARLEEARNALRALRKAGSAHPRHGDAARP